MLYEKTTNMKSGRVSGQISIDLGATIGLGLIANFGIKWPIFKLQ
jgi:hypothetical protein